MLEIFHKPVHPLEPVSHSTAEVLVMVVLWRTSSYHFTPQFLLPTVLIWIPPEAKSAMKIRVQGFDLVHNLRKLGKI